MTKRPALISLSTLILALAALGAFTSQGAEITRVDSNANVVWVGGIPNQEWKINDSVCFYQGDGMLGCGVVTTLTQNAAGVKVTERKRQLYAGDQVILRRNLRSPATTQSVSEKIDDGSKRTYVDAGLGMTAGFNYFYPMAHFQFAVSRNWSLGIMPVFASYSQSANSVTFYGGYLTATYYHTHFAFKGVNFEGGLGYFHIGANAGALEQTTSPMAAKFSVGWRGRALWGAPLDLGVAAGAQYVFLDTAPLDIGFKKLLPLLSVFIAYSF